MPYKSGNWRDSHTVTEEDRKLKMPEPNTQSGPQRQTLLTGKPHCEEDPRWGQLSAFGPGSCRCRQVPGRGDAVVLPAVAGWRHSLCWQLCAVVISFYSHLRSFAPNTHVSRVPWMFNKYVLVSLRSMETSLDEFRVSFLTTPKRSMLATWVVVSPPRSRVKNQRTS